MTVAVGAQIVNPAGAIVPAVTLRVNDQRAHMTPDGARALACALEGWAACAELLAEEVAEGTELGHLALVDVGGEA